jgi:hypothetical protein
VTFAKRIALSSLVLVGLGLGCANRSHVSDHWGESYRTLKAQQIANPDAGQEVQVVEGMSSTTARDVSATYHTRQAEQPQTRQDSSLIEILSSGE